MYEEDPLAAAIIKPAGNPHNPGASIHLPVILIVVVTIAASESVGAVVVLLTCLIPANHPRVDPFEVFFDPFSRCFGPNLVLQFAGKKLKMVECVRWSCIA